MRKNQKMKKKDNVNKRKGRDKEHYNSLRKGKHK